MRAWISLLAAMALMVSAHAAAACEAPAGKAGGSPVELRKPLVGDEVHLTSGFGLRRHPILGQPRMHTGIDWAAPTGTPVIAAGTGRVLSAEPRGEYGNAILIDHGGGWQTLYAQLSSFDVREGECVTTRMPIGKVGSTGLSAGPHLHFELRRHGVPIDPLTIRGKDEPVEAGDGK